MGAEGYFKAAAHNLRQAAQAKKAEADELRRNLARQESQQKTEVDNLKMQERLHQVELNSTGDSGRKKQLTQETVNLHTQAKRTEKQLAQTREKMSQVAAAKEQEANAIAKEASRFEGRS